MGNSYGVPWFRAVGEAEAAAIFDRLDRDRNGYVTLKELMGVGGPGLMMPHSLPALYFFDKENSGTLTRSEFVALLRFCEDEKRKVEADLERDSDLRDVIRRASAAGVKDGSAHGRVSFRSISSYANVRTIFRTDALAAAVSRAADAKLDSPAHSDCDFHNGDSALSPQRLNDEAAAASSASQPSTSNRSSLERPPTTPPAGRRKPPRPHLNGVPLSCSPVGAHTSGFESTDAADGHDEESDSEMKEGVRMYSTQREFENYGDASKVDDVGPLEAESRTAIDAAVLERIMCDNIQKLGEDLQNGTLREEFMEWLWKLTDFNRQEVITLEELRIFLQALEEDGILLEELAFYKEGGVPLEESIINEFDTTHTGLLTRDEFLVLADLVTREYEHWTNRHLDRVGDYELGRTIGRGSSGIVRLATHVPTRAQYAIKIIKKGNCSALSRLDREIASLASAGHENIVELMEVLDSEENVFIVMELCGGGSLVDIVMLYNDERIPETHARFYCRQLFEALAFLHRNGICHRDIRLDNLMLSNDGVLKITDFGHSGVYQPGWDLFSTTLVGSVYNLSPEQIEGKAYSGEKIDVWSAGIVLYCILVGHPPFFDSDTNTFLNSILTGSFVIPDFVSAEGAELIRCMIRVNPVDRLPFEQLQMHPWFYSGQESRPVMDTVVIPVDSFFKRRPDLAEMIMAMTMYENNLHFHLADTTNPRSFPDVLRGQAWALKCMSLDLNIRFTVSLFTQEPRNPSQRTHHVASMPKLLNAMDNPELAGSGPSTPQLTSSDMGSPTVLHRATSTANERANSDLGIRVDPDPFGISLPPSVQEMHVCSEETPTTSLNGLNGSGPPARRANSETDVPPQTFVDPELGFGGSLSEGELGSPSGDKELRGGPGPKRRSRGPCHVRSKSLDFTEDWELKISRSVTVDAFPYHMVLPQREMPEEARVMSFDRPDDSLTDRSDDALKTPRISLELSKLARIRDGKMSRSRTLENLPSATGSLQDRLLGDTPIVRCFQRYPSKSVPAQSPPSKRANTAPVESVASTFDDASEVTASSPQQRSRKPPAPACCSRQQRCKSDSVVKPSVPEFMPYIEVRLRDGESGLFLRVCRKLKTICGTKLANAAERQKRRITGRRSVTMLRRSAAQRSGSCAAVANGRPASLDSTREEHGV